MFVYQGFLYNIKFYGAITNLLQLLFVEKMVYKTMYVKVKTTFSYCCYYYRISVDFWIKT